MAAMIPNVSTASRATDANPSGNASHTTSRGAEFESMLSSIEARTLKNEEDSDNRANHGKDRLEVNDDCYTTNQDEVTPTDESNEPTDEVSETDLYNTLIEFLHKLLAEAGFQSMESEVGSMQESLDEKLKKLNELVSAMKNKNSGESLFDLTAFNSNEPVKKDDQRDILQQMLKETASLNDLSNADKRQLSNLTSLNDFSDVDKKQLSNLASILNKELGKKDVKADSNVLKVENGVLKAGNGVLKVEDGVLKVEPDILQIEVDKNEENLSNQLRVDQLFHTLRSNVGQNSSVSVEIPRAPGPVDQLSNHLRPEKLESARSALEQLLDNVRTGPNLQANNQNVGNTNAGIDSKENRVMATQILPRIETALKTGETNFKMILSPHGLGQVEVKLLLEDGKLKVQLAASSSLTAELLSAQVDELIKALGTKDIQITNSGHNQDFADDKNSEFLNDFFKQNEGRKEREGNQQGSENESKTASDLGERVEAKLVNPKIREGNLLGRI